MPVKSIIVEAVGVAEKNDKDSEGRPVETPMTRALKKAIAAGITNPDEIRSRMLAARERARKRAAAREVKYWEAQAAKRKAAAAKRRRRR